MKNLIAKLNQPLPDKIVGIVLAILFLLTCVGVVFSQTENAPKNTVTVMAGTTHNEEIGDIKAGSPTVAVEYEHRFNEKWNLDVTATYAADRSRTTGRGSTFNVTPFLEYNITSKFFVGGALALTKNTTPEYGDLVGVNPTFEAGLTLPYKKVTFEPYVQAATPDIIQSSKLSNAGGGLNFYWQAGRNWGFRASGSAFRNYWKNSDNTRGAEHLQI
jgi:hypothetical protein